MRGYSTDLNVGSHRGLGVERVACVQSEEIFDLSMKLQKPNLLIFQQIVNKKKLLILMRFVCLCLPVVLSCLFGDTITFGVGKTSLEG